MKLRYTALVFAPDKDVEQLSVSCAQLLALCQANQVLMAIGTAGKRLPACGRGGPRIVFIAGSVTPQSLIDTVFAVHKRGAKPIVVVDALQTSAGSYLDLHEALKVLNEKSFQLAHTGEIASLLGLNWHDLQMYRFAKADNTASVAVFLDGGKRILAIKRKHNPDKGKWALPGGFLNCQLETLEECGARELSEEAKVEISPSDLFLIDVRSSPRRDSRQHVVDHGFGWLVPADREAEMVACMQFQDDAEALEVVETAWLLQQDIAFDHHLIIERGLAHIAANA